MVSTFNKARLACNSIASYVKLFSQHNLCTGVSQSVRMVGSSQSVRLIADSELSKRIGFFPGCGLVTFRVRGKVSCDSNKSREMFSWNHDAMERYIKRIGLV